MSLLPVQILWDDSTRQYVLPYKHLTKLGEVRTELQLLDPADNWAFLGWLLDERRMQVNLLACMQAALYWLLIRM